MPGPIGSDPIVQLARTILLETLDYGHLDCSLSTWSVSSAKRYFDTVLAFLALFFTAPFMLLASVFVLSSGCPLLFESIRVGKEGKQIRVLKFRTMRQRQNLGVQLTRGRDERITPAGGWLRKWKLDELPQFINVLRGEMSLVGPRPDSPEFVETLPRYVRNALLRVRPGITSVASLTFRDESALLAHVPEGELTRYYTHTLLPHKVSLDLDYASRATLFSDLRLLLRTALTILR